MRKINIIALAVLVSIGLTNCDTAKDALDVDFTTDISGAIPVSAANTDEATYSEVLDATSDPEFQKYADKIKNVEVAKLVLEVKDYSAGTSDEIYFNGDLGFSAKNGTQPTSTCSISNLNITHIANTGAFEINNCNDVLSDIGTMLTNDNAVKVYLVGAVTKSPVAFKLELTATVKVTANPL